MPLSTADREEIRRIMREVAEERARPIEAHLKKHSGKFIEVREEVSPAVARRISDSEHEIEDRSLGFERTVMTAIGRVADGVNNLNSRLVAIEKQNSAQLVEVKDGKGTTSLVPAAIVASARVEGKQEATQIAANRAETQSLAAKVAGNRATVVIIIQTILIGVWQAVSHLLAHASP